MLTLLMPKEMSSAEFAALKNVSVDKVLRAARRVEGTRQAFGKRVRGTGQGSAWIFTAADSERFDRLQKHERPAQGDLHVRVDEELLRRVDETGVSRSEAAREGLELWLKRENRRAKYGKPQG